MHPDRLFPPDAGVRDLAKRLYALVADLPIISPHGHTDPRWFADNVAFRNATELLLTPDHYLFRMLFSQGIPLPAIGVSRADGSSPGADARACWRTFAQNYHLFRGTPSRLWLDWVFANVFGMEVQLDAETADGYFDAIGEKLARPEFRPRSLFDRFNIEVLTTTESPLDDLRHHAAIRDCGWEGRVVTAYRPDPAVDPEFEGFRDNVQRLGELTGEDTATWSGYLAAHRSASDFFRQAGATSTDHGHPTARTADLDRGAAEALFMKVLAGKHDAADAELFRAQMLMEMAHYEHRRRAGDADSSRLLPQSSSPDPQDVRPRQGRRYSDAHGFRERAEAAARRRSGNDARLSVILFTLDESTYSRELAPLAGVYPSLKLGPAWWFHDSPAGIRRFREQTTETAGFYNTVGFNDDTRAFLSIPARHDVARRVDCAYLASLVAEHRMSEDDAAEVAVDLVRTLPRKAYKLDR